jgi:exodeoxyribonuclease-1
MHPTNSNGVVVYDLRQDPSAWIDLPADEIRRLVFSASDDLEEGESRLPIKTIHINRCPVVVSLSVLEEDKAAAYGIDLDDCRRHWQLLAQRKDLVPRIGAALKEERQGAEADPDFMIYSGGFFSDSDKSLMQTVRGTRAEDLGRLDLPFRDPRLQEMLFRYRARNFPDSLNESEKRRWDQFRSDRVLSEAVTRRYQDEFTEAMNRADQSQQAKLLELNSYVENLIKEIESASN